MSTGKASSPQSHEDFGAALKRWRTAAGLTQAELADRTDISVNGISDLERGARRHPHGETARLLTAALGLTPEDAAEFLAAWKTGRPTE